MLVFARGVYRLWQGWEKLFRVLAGVQPICEHDKPLLFFIAKRTYLGRPFLADDVRVLPFQKVVELHMNNDLLKQVLRTETTLVGVAIRLIREARETLPILAELLSTPEFDDVEVLYGVTFIHRGIQKLGFHTAEIRNRFIRYVSTWYLLHVFNMVNPDAKAVLGRHHQGFYPKMVAITKAELVARYRVQHPMPVPARDHCLT